MIMSVMQFVKEKHSFILHSKQTRNIITSSSVFILCLKFIITIIIVVVKNKHVNK